MEAALPPPAAQPLLDYEAMICLAWRADSAALWAAISVVLLPFAALAGCNRAQSQDVAAKPKPPEVFFSLPEVRRVTDHEDFTGYTQAIKTVQIRARVSGYLDKVNFIEGAMVNEGDVLCEVDPRPYQAAYDSAVGQYHRQRGDPQGSQSRQCPGEKPG